MEGGSINLPPGFRQSGRDASDSRRMWSRSEPIRQDNHRNRILCIMQCPLCAADIPDDSLFCPECGSRVEVPKTALTAGHSAQMREYPPIPAEVPMTPSTTGHTVPAETAVPSSSRAMNQDRSFRKALYEMNGRMEKVLMGISEIDYTDPAAERRIHEALRDESAACAALLGSFTVSPALEPLQRSALASLENYGLAAVYYMQFLDERDAHGQTATASSLWDQSTEFFMKGIDTPDRSRSTMRPARRTRTPSSWMPASGGSSRRAPGPCIL